MSPYHTTLRPDEIAFVPETKNVKIEVSLPYCCPKCSNRNSNIEGSVYDDSLCYKFSCMQCGHIYIKLKDTNLS